MAGDQPVNFVEYPDREVQAMDLADRLMSELNMALHQSDEVTLAVAGGTTPGPVFDLLCDADIDWARITVMPTDERWVPEDHERSNARLIRERLLKGRAAKASYLSLYAGGSTPEDALPALCETVAARLPLSVVMLGMGGDMHTASLFPGTPGLPEALTTEAPLAVMRPESQPEPRISLSAKALAGAMNCHLMITGADKRAALDRAQGLPPEDAPVRAILNGTTIHWAE